MKADKPIFHDGKPYQNGAQVSGLYGQVNVSEKFYGVEVILHYLLLKGNVGYGGASVQERITVLYEETPRFKALHPRTFESKPFAVNKDGSFVDRQLFGRFDSPLTAPLEIQQGILPPESLPDPVDRPSQTNDKEELLRSSEYIQLSRSRREALQSF